MSAEGIELTKNRNTFFKEYMNQEFIDYKKKPIPFKIKAKCFDKKPINKTVNFILQDYGQTNYKIMNNTNMTYFNYDVDNQDLTILNKPNLYLEFKIYDMKSLISKIKFEFKVPNDKIIDLLNEEIE